jgi:hypothetical protein
MCGMSQKPKVIDVQFLLPNSQCHFLAAQLYHIKVVEVAIS